MILGALEDRGVAAHGLRWGRVFLIVLIVLSFLFTTPGDSDARRRRRRRLPTYQLYGWHGNLSLEVRNNIAERTTSGKGDPADTSEWSVREGFKLRTRGWLYHPALINFTSRLGLVFDQDFIAVGSENELSQVDGTQVDFGVDVNALPNKPYPMSLSIGQSYQQQDSPFEERRTVQVFRVGSSLRLPKLTLGEYKVPMRFAYERVQNETSGNFGDKRIEDRVDIEADNQTSRTRNNLDYDWRRTASEAQGGSGMIERHRLRLHQERDLDNDGRLSSDFVAHQDAGDIQGNLASLNEALILKHSESLSSHLAYGAVFQDTGNNKSLYNSLRLGLNHRLYQSLFSSVSFGATYGELTSGTTSGFSGNAGVRYTKEIPGGRMGLSFNPSYTYNEEKNDEGALGSVADERHSIAFGQLILLEQPFILSESIVVIDPESGQRFFVNEDFFIVEDGLKTLLEINPLGNLNPDLFPVVRVDYEYELQPSRTYATTVYASSFNLHLLDHFTLTLNYSDTSQDLKQGRENDSTITDETNFNANFDAVFKNNHTRARYENVKSDITPRVTYSVSHDVGYRVSPRLNLGAGVVYSFTDLPDSDRQSEYYGVTGRGTSILPYRIISHFSVYARRSTEPEQDVTAYGGIIDFNYRYRLLTFKIENRIDWRQNEIKLGTTRTSDELLNTIYFRAERRF